MDPHFDGVIFQTHAAELGRRLRYPFPPFLVLDVRPAEAYAGGHLPGAISTSPAELAGGLPPGAGEHTELFVVGAGPEDRALRQASLALLAAGAHRVVEFTGGMLEWGEAGGTLEGGKGPAERAA